MTPQGTAEWRAQRCGKLTASRLGDALAKTRNGYGASRAAYLAELVAERLTGEPTERFVTFAMQRGIELEAEARALYAITADGPVVECGFVEHPRIPMAGASPDGLVGDDGLVEIKCPNSVTQIARLCGEPIPDVHLLQMQWQMACTGRAWCDYVSYDPRMPAALRLHVVRVERADDGEIARIEQEAAAFLAEVEAKTAALAAMMKE